MEEEQILTESEAADDNEFDAQWDEWSVRQAFQNRALSGDDLKIICKVWFGRGVARGTEWGIEQIDRAQAMKAN